jgi:hypothetical protein
MKVLLAASHKPGQLINISSLGACRIETKGQQLDYLPGGRGVAEFEVTVIGPTYMTTGRVPTTDD